VKRNAVLFVTPNELIDSRYGGSKVSLYMYQNISGKYDCCEVLELGRGDIFNKSSLKKIGSLFNLLFFFNGNNSFLNLYRFIRLIKSKCFTDVYMDGSYFGVNILVVKLFFPNIRIITFFHNIEYRFYLGGMAYNKVFLLKLFSAFFNDKISIKLSHEIVTISEFDYVFINSHKKIGKVNLVFPDIFVKIEARKDLLFNYKVIGFIGSGFHGNLMLIEKFYNDVLKNSSFFELHVYGYGYPDRFCQKYRDTSKIFFHGSFTNEIDVISNHSVFLNSGLIQSGLQIKSLLYLRYNKIILSYSPIFLCLNYSASVLLLGKCKIENLDFSLIERDSEKFYNLMLRSFPVNSGMS
jgi:hypothetical protein